MSDAQDRAELRATIRAVVDRIETDGIPNEYPGSPAWCHDYTEALVTALAEHDRRVGARALREAADSEFFDGSRRFLRERAGRMAGEGT